MKYNVGDAVSFQGQICTIHRFAGVMQTTTGTINKYDILDWTGNVIIENVSEIELSQEDI